MGMREGFADCSRRESTPWIPHSPPQWKSGFLPIRCGFGDTQGSLDAFLSAVGLDFCQKFIGVIGYIGYKCCAETMWFWPCRSPIVYPTQSPSEFSCPPFQASGQFVRTFGSFPAGWPVQHEHLLAQGRNLQRQILSRPKEHASPRQHAHDEAKHEPILQHHRSGQASRLSVQAVDFATEFIFGDAQVKRLDLFVENREEQRRGQ